jgi:Protein of unknown function (DUF4232)
MRVRAIVTAVSTLALLTGLTACTGGVVSGSVTVNPSTPAPTSGAALASAPSASSSAAPTTSAHAAPVSAPQPASFTAELDIQRQDVGMVTLTNTSDHPVTVQGWTPLTFTNQHGDTLPVPVRKVEVPGPGRSLTVLPGSSVFAAVTWKDGDKASSSTFVSDGVALTAPGAKSPIGMKVVGIDGQAPAYYEFDITSVELGPLQPDTHNLLEF